MRVQSSKPKPVRWIGSALDDLRSLPEHVQGDFGHALWLIQTGETPGDASPFEGSHGAAIMRIAVRNDDDTYRLVYTAKFDMAIYVLHVFMKKSHTGRRTPKTEIEAVQKRFRAALEDYASTVRGLGLTLLSAALESD